MASRVVLHVGTPKSGTTYLQRIAWDNEDRLADHGVTLPLDGRFAVDQAVGDVLGIKRRVARGKAQVTWDRLVEAAGSAAGTALVSNEALAGARAEHVDRIVETLGPDRVHVVITARDPVRQLPSVWQQELKHGRRLGFPGFLDLVAAGTHPRWNGQQDVPDLIARWTARLPAAQVHVVTVPPPGAPSRTLWDRFATVLGLDPDSYELPGQASNTGLDVAGAEALRRLNSALDGRLSFPIEYVPTVRHLAVPALAAGTPTAPVRLPADRLGWAQDLGRDLAARIAETGVEVVGDLADLTGSLPGEAASAAGQAVDEAEVARRLVAALAEVSVAHARARAHGADLRERLGQQAKRPGGRGPASWLRRRRHHGLGL